jgi:hypothetical protein
VELIDEAFRRRVVHNRVVRFIEQVRYIELLCSILKSDFQVKEL